MGRLQTYQTQREALKTQVTEILRPLPVAEQARVLNRIIVEHLITRYSSSTFRALLFAEQIHLDLRSELNRALTTGTLASRVAEHRALSSFASSSTPTPPLLTLSDLGL